MVTEFFESNVTQQQTEQTKTADKTFTLSGEAIAYFALILLALLLRLAELDVVPMSDSEVPAALGAWHLVFPDAPGDTVQPNSPILFWGQTLTFSIMGGTEFASRLPTVIASLLLILLPYLFRDRIGRSQAFIWSTLLALSPIAFVAARLSSSVVWSVLFAGVLLHFLWRYYLSKAMSDILWASGFLAGLLFLSEPGGLILALIMLLAGLIAIWLTVANSPLELDVPGDEVLVNIRNWLGSLPWQYIIGMIALVVLVISTAFMSYPSGLAMIGELIADAVAGFGQPLSNTTPSFAALTTLLAYDPILIGFAAVAILALLRNSEVTFIHRFVFAWLGVGLVFMVIYRAATPNHALWLLLPLSFFASQIINDLLVDRSVTVYWNESTDDDTTTRFWWVKWALAAVLLFLLLMITVHIQEIGRVIIQVPQGLNPDELLQTLQQPGYVTVLSSGLWVVLTSLIAVIGFFLAASIWGNTNTLQGVGIGFLVFMVAANLASGWNTAVVGADYPGELWHYRATNSEIYLLRESLFEVSQRDTQGFPLIPITVYDNPEDSLMDSDGLIAWLLRDFPNTQFVSILPEVKRDQIVILPAQITDPDLGGSYVGQSFTIYNTWTTGSQSLGDALAWLTQRHIRPETVFIDSILLWLRLDVYDGIPLEERP